MKTSRLPVAVALAATIASMGAAPAQARVDPTMPPAFIFAPGGGGCANRTFIDCKMLHLKVDLPTADTLPERPCSCSCAAAGRTRTSR